MSESTTPVEIATTYFEAGARGDLDTLMSVVSDDVVAQSPVGPIEGAAAFRGFWENFGRMYQSIELVGTYGDDTTAALFYNGTSALGTLPSSERQVIENGKIASVVFIWDMAPFAAGAPASGS